MSHHTKDLAREIQNINSGQLERLVTRKDIAILLEKFNTSYREEARPRKASHLL
jgi:hypothetical protein